MDPARYPCAECLSPNPWVRCGECFSLRQGQYPLPILLILVSPLTVPAVSCCCRRLPPFFSAMPSCIERASCAESSLAVRGSARPERLARSFVTGPASLPNAPRPSWRPAKNLDSVPMPGCLRCASLKERRARVGRTRPPVWQILCRCILRGRPVRRTIPQPPGRVGFLPCASKHGCMMRALTPAGKTKTPKVS